MTGLLEPLLGLDLLRGSTPATHTLRQHGACASHACRRQSPQFALATRPWIWLDLASHVQVLALRQDDRSQGGGVVTVVLHTICFVSIKMKR